jgi:hypothetical protein
MVTDGACLPKNSKTFERKLMGVRSDYQPWRPPDEGERYSARERYEFIRHEFGGLIQEGST